MIWALSLTTYDFVTKGLIAFINIAAIRSFTKFSKALAPRPK